MFFAVFCLPAKAIGEVLIKAHDFLETDVRFLSEATYKSTDEQRFNNSPKAINISPPYWQ